MSPSESQLRAALQDGEGDAPDATVLIANALRVQHNRRRRMTSIAGGVAVVAVLGVGMTALVSAGQDDERAGGASSRQAAGAGQAASRKDKAAAPQTGRHSAAASSAKPSASGTSRARQCPTTPDRYMLPGGGGSGQFGSNDPLFTSPVAALTVCGYPAGAGVQPRRNVIGKAESSQLVTALESAPTTASARSCADNTYQRGTVEILAVDAKGRPLKPVVVTLNCRSSQATNGTAVRYLDTVPDQLVQLVQ